MSQNQSRLQIEYDRYQQTIEQLSTTSIQLQQQLDEYKIVLKTLTEVPSDRKCYRNLGEGLVEMTAGEGKMKLESEIKEFEKSFVMVEKELKTKQEDFIDWKSKNNVQIVKAH